MGSNKKPPALSEPKMPEPECGPHTGYLSMFPEDAVAAHHAAWQAYAAGIRAEAQGEAVAWQSRLADALEAFWNPAVGAIQDASYHGPASGSDVVGAIAQGLAAVAGALREQQTVAPKPVEGVTEPWYGHRFCKGRDGRWRCADGCGPVLVEEAPQQGDKKDEQ